MCPPARTASLLGCLSARLIVLMRQPLALRLLSCHLCIQQILWAVHAAFALAKGLVSLDVPCMRLGLSLHSSFAWACRASQAAGVQQAAATGLEGQATDPPQLGVMATLQALFRPHLQAAALLQSALWGRHPCFGVPHAHCPLQAAGSGEHLLLSEPSMLPRVPECTSQSPWP